jgi:hypothetical protein
MAKRVTEQNDDGEIVTWKPRRVREVDFPVTKVTTRRQRIIRALVG